MVFPRCLSVHANVPTSTSATSNEGRPSTPPGRTYLFCLIVSRVFASQALSAPSQPVWPEFFTHPLLPAFATHFIRNVLRLPLNRAILSSSCPSGSIGYALTGLGNTEIDRLMIQRRVCHLNDWISTSKLHLRAQGYLADGEPSPMELVFRDSWKYIRGCL